MVAVVAVVSGVEIAAAARPIAAHRDGAGRMAERDDSAAGQPGAVRSNGGESGAGDAAGGSRRGSG